MYTSTTLQMNGLPAARTLPQHTIIWVYYSITDNTVHWIYLAGV